MDLVPTKYLVDAAATLSETRAASLEFRFDHERHYWTARGSGPFLAGGDMVEVVCMTYGGMMLVFPTVVG